MDNETSNGLNGMNEPAVDSSSHRSGSSVEVVFESNAENSGDEVVTKESNASMQDCPIDALAANEHEHDTPTTVGDGRVIPPWVDSIVDAKMALVHGVTAVHERWKGDDEPEPPPPPRTVTPNVNSKETVANRSSKRADDVDGAFPIMPPTARAVDYGDSMPTARAVDDGDNTALEEERMRFREHVRNALTAEAVQAEAVVPSEVASSPPGDSDTPKRKRLVGGAVAAVTLVAIVAASVTAGTQHRLRKSPTMIPPDPPTQSTTPPTNAPRLDPIRRPDGRLAFTETIQLHEAVDAYMEAIGSNGTAKGSDVASQYGYPIGTWDVSRLSDFSRVFNVDRFQPIEVEARTSQRSKFNESLSGWDVSNAKSMVAMFAGATDFVGEGISGWNVGKVTDFSFAFFETSSFVGNISGWDTSSATNVKGMFYRAVTFNGNLALWDVSNVENMGHMFSGAYKFTGGDLTRWNVAKVRDMTSMFSEGWAFNGTVSTWDTSNLETMDSMFQDAMMFAGDLSSWSLSKVVSMEGVFVTARAFVGGDLTKWNTSRVKTMNDLFDGCINLRANVSSWDVSRVESFHKTFAYCDHFNSDLSQWDTSSAKSMTEMFSHTALFNSSISSWNTSKVTNLFEMFYNADVFTGDLSSWDVSNVVDMSGLFKDANLYQQDLCAWGPKLQPNVKVAEMFSGSDCAEQSDPSIDPAAAGPFCAVCP